MAVLRLTAIQQPHGDTPPPQTGVKHNLVFADKNIF